MSSPTVLFKGSSSTYIDDHLFKAIVVEDYITDKTRNTNIACPYCDHKFKGSEFDIKSDPFGRTSYLSCPRCYSNLYYAEDIIRFEDCSSLLIPYLKRHYDELERRRKIHFA